MEIDRCKLYFCLLRITIAFIVFSNYLAKSVSTTSTPPNHLSTQQSVVSVTSDYQEYYEEQNDPSELFNTGTSHCRDKSFCSDWMYQTFPNKNCHCDELCGILDDCCGNFYPSTGNKLKKDQFSCVRLNEIIKNENYGVHMVTKCSEEWDHNATKYLCEGDTHSDNILHKLPVSRNSVMYKNMYCAQCNFIYAFEYWKPEIKCLNETGVRSLPEMTDCDWFYIRPKPEIGYRTCQLKPRVIETCLGSNSEQYKIENDNCTGGVYSVVYDSSGHAYRNNYCAACNDIKTELYCELILPSATFSTPKPVPKKVYSFRLLVDFNDGTVSENGVISDIHICNDNEIYDSFSQKCREIFCAPPSLAVQGLCILNNSKDINDTNTSTENCTLVKLDKSEYMITNNSQLYLISDNKTYSREEFQVIGSDAFICLQTIRNCSHECDEPESLFQFNMIESYMSLVGLIISICSLAITLLVYITFSQLLNIPGKILVCLIISLLFAQLLFLISAESENISQLCISVAVLTHYFFLAAFCWMNVIALDLWITFSNKFMSGGSRRNKKRFLKYNLYAWMTPFVIVCSAVALNFSPFDNEYATLKPRYGKDVCWISSKNGLFLFFAGPLALFKLFDVVSFVFTAIHIARAKQQGAMATQKSSSCSFLINLKLSLIMGLTWVFAFVANITNETSMWYLFIIFNSLQGLFIAVCFLCTRKVGRMLYDKYEQLSSKSTSGTQLSSLP
ncbi:probable G-protein coupled receptor Mth-like 11 [Mercenaria mercenaria]|uniref:probable G-protein coupled receptor Mth-like 11 n=1 Tax=Mercenaria mercenaria TaxID=6596 RepID=UPI00234F993A|nr:probable G-protein coupled receptor Mth-like 11 [Mercenaria mercenaria]